MRGKELGHDALDLALLWWWEAWGSGRKETGLRVERLFDHLQTDANDDALSGQLHQTACTYLSIRAVEEGLDLALGQCLALAIVLVRRRAANSVTAGEAGLAVALGAPFLDNAGQVGSVVWERGLAG